MSEINATQTPQPRPKTICTIRIMFPVDSDEQAISYKKQISEILSTIPDAQIQFSLMTGRPPIPSM